jgi:hypothetical protein
MQKAYDTLSPSTGYAIQDKGVGFSITAYKPQKDATQFVESIDKCLRDVHSVLEGKMPNKS